MTTNTNNTTIQTLINLADNYDRFTAYMDNYRQQREAERASMCLRLQMRTQRGWWRSPAYPKYLLYQRDKLRRAV